MPDASIEQADWDASKVHEKLCHDIEAHASFVRKEKLSELTAQHEVPLVLVLLWHFLFQREDMTQDIGGRLF